MAPAGKRTVDEFEDALALIAEWLIAIYGSRLNAVVLTLRGFDTTAPEDCRIVPWLDRNEGETPDMLPSRQVQDLAEGAFAALFPHARVDGAISRDLPDFASWGRSLHSVSRHTVGSSC